MAHWNATMSYWQLLLWDCLIEMYFVDHKSAHKLCDQADGHPHASWCDRNGNDSQDTMKPKPNSRGKKLAMQSALT